MRRFVIAIVALFGLGGCAGLAAAGASVATAGSSFFVGAAQQDMADVAEWRGTQKAIVAEALQAMKGQARQLEIAGDWPGARAMYFEALAFNECHQPLILAERLAARYRRAKGEGDPAPAPPDDCGAQPRN